MEENIDLIEAYTAKFPELQESHHFLYDLKFPKDLWPEFVIMGINPGEAESDWLVPGPAQETSRSDFHDHPALKSREGLNWTKRCDDLVGGRPFVQTEFFFWSSKGVPQLKERVGPLHRSPHLAFCTRLNRELIEHYKPRAVIFTGLGMIPLCASEFGLRFVRKLAGSRRRLIEEYTDGQRPWLFTLHLTGPRPSLVELDALAKAVAAL